MLFSEVNAQEQNNKKLPNLFGSSAVPNDSTVHKNYVAIKDLFDVVSSLLRKHPIAEDNVDSLSTKPIYSIVPAVGYTLQTKLAAVISGNVVFRTVPQANLSTITASATYTQNKQFFIPILSNISIKDNRYKLIGDFRFYKYPQSTFGLGSNSSISNEDPMVYDYFRFYETVLRKIKGNFYAGLGYNFDRHWRISHKGNPNGAESDYSKYETVSETTSSGITANGLFDSRDNPINAKKGLYASVQVRNNFRAIGSNSNWRSATLDIRKYVALPGKSKNTLAFWSYNTYVIDGKPPYLDLPSTGWDNYNATGRGFIQGRFRGAKMIYFETEYRFKITSNGLFGGVVYANEQAFSTVPHSSLQAFQAGYGTGLRIKLNKKSDTNLAIDYAFGTQGSKGLFITVGELF
ncbi:hypothetical protein SAE01_44970 [Segetibacter aerophilus]|uniref:Bacterial surface antigen (D15) domain-containing protein n=1 Tax=Segetibacter aerophilus TaxID=670293 RepID=A0A512BJ52_9BACT|nr:hypothetical protein SAE01_44970 [Segetibacter aerophilus]